MNVHMTKEAILSLKALKKLLLVKSEWLLILSIHLKTKNLAIPGLLKSDQSKKELQLCPPSLSY